MVDDNDGEQERSLDKNSERFALVLVKNKHTNTIQDDIADMFNEEQPAGAYQTLVEGMDKDIKSLADEILEAIKKK